MKKDIKENQNRTLLAFIEQEVAEVEAEDDKIHAVADEIAAIERELNARKGGEATDADLQRAKQRAEESLAKFKDLLNKKSAMYAELLNKSKMLVDMNDQIIKNEEEAMSLQQEIDVSLLELEQKRTLAEELAEELADKKAIYKALRADIKRLDAEVERLQAILRDREEELQINSELIAQRELELVALEKATGRDRPTFDDEPYVPEVKPAVYRAVKGDLVDELLARYINEAQCTLPIRRLGDGFYMFGTKKIYAKVMNGKLVVRVGGGYMAFQEYLETHVIQEGNRIAELVAKGEWDEEGLFSYFKGEMSPGHSAPNRGSVGRKSLVVGNQ